MAVAAQNIVETRNADSEPRDIDNVATRGYIGTMKTVGVRELKNHLSEYLRHVRSGDSVLVTDRGEIIAELSPPGHGSVDASVPAGLAALGKQGLVRLGSGGAGAYPALRRARRRKHTAAQLLDEERGSW